MKTKRLYAYAFIAIFALAICTLSCSGDNDEPTPKPEEPKGEVSYVINNGNGGSSTTTPTVVTTGQPLNMTISQKSSYTDSDGKVFSCEPKATISLKVTADTVRVKDLTTLTSVTQKGNPNTSTNGTNPAQTKITQVFEVAGEDVSFDLGYEIYRYTNAANRTIEMPYIKLSPASYGAADTKQTTRSAEAVTSVRLTPITPVATTRGEVVSSTTMYKVNVSFNLDMQTQNTGNDATTPLSFETEFVGIVESTTELPDATTNLSYQLNVLSGTTSTASPFSVTLGEEFSLEWVQNSQYTYFSATELTGKTVGEKPKATIKIMVPKDTLWANSVEDLEKVTEAAPVETTSGENPMKHTTKQSFDIGGKTINVDWSYEAYAKATINGKEVELPYLELGKVEVANVTKTEINAEQVSGKAAKAYEVKVTLRQSLNGKNTPNEVAETVEYIVKYIAAVEAKLISTTYEKDYEWLEPWCDLSWRYNYIVRRIRTYSTGEKETDEFRLPVGARVGLGGAAYQYLFSESKECQIGSLHAIYHNNYYDDIDNDDFRFVATTKTGVSDITLISGKITEEEDAWNERNFSHYQMVLGDEFYNPSSPKENWYSRGIIRSRSLQIFCNEPGYETEWIRLEVSWINFADCFLYLDGQIIEFPEYRMTYNFDFREENISFNGSPAKVFTNEIKGKYLGKDFYAATVDTVYQIK
jgi:hypothetical protein